MSMRSVSGSPYYGFAGVPVADGPRAPRSLPHRNATILIVVAVVIVLLGLIAGAVWAAVTPAMSGERVAAGALIPQQEFGEEFAGIAVFALVMCAFGAVAAAVAWVAARGWRGVEGYAMLVGSVVVGTGVAGLVGTWIARWRFTAPADAAVGQGFRLVPDLWLDGLTRGSPSGAWILVICAPLTATVVYLLCVLITRAGDLGVGDAADAPSR